MPNSKLDNLVDDVIKTTKSGDTRWAVTRNDYFINQVLHGGFIYRSYKADYEKDGDTYILGFVVKKAPHPDSDDERIEDPDPELLVFDDEKLILTVTEYDVDISKLRTLTAVIGGENDDAKGLLAKF